MTHFSVLITQIDKNISNYETFKETSCRPQINKMSKELSELNFKVDNLNKTVSSINNLQSDVSNLLWVNRFKQWVLSAGIMGTLGIISMIFHFYSIVITNQKQIDDINKKIVILVEADKKHDDYINKQLIIEKYKQKDDRLFK